MHARRSLTLTVAAAALSVVALGAPGARASGGSPGVRASGACAASSSSSTWRLTAKPDDGKVEVGFEVDSNQAGQTWAVRVTDNATQVFAGSRRTVAPSGSFTVDLRTTNRAGTDTIRSRATNAATGQVCSGKVVL
jgi:hypothetical protein